MSRTRLLAVTHDYSLTGAPIALFNLLIGLKSEFEITVASGADSPLRQDYVSAGIRAIVLPDLLSRPSVTAEQLKSHDVLLSNTMMSLVPILAASRESKPSLWYVHEAEIGQSILRNVPPGRIAMAQANCVGYPTRYTQQLFRPFRDDRWTELIRYGVANQSEGHGGADPSQFRILQLGIISKRKAQDVALAAMRRLNDPTIRLDIVGRPEDDNIQSRLASEYSDLTNVTFRPAVTRAETIELMRNYDLLILPSRDDVAPMVILEAMSIGLPVIASRVGGVPELITHEQTGLLFQSEQPSELADTVRLVREDVSFRIQVGAKGRQFQRENFTFEKSRMHLAEILLRLTRQTV